MDTTVIVGVVAALAAGAGIGFVFGKRQALSCVQRALTARLNGERAADNAELLAIVDKIAAARTDELQQKLTAARADIADMAAASVEQKLVRRIDEDVQALTTVSGVLDKTVHRIVDEMRDDIKGCIAYQVVNDAPRIATSYGVDEQVVQAASTKALVSMLPTIVANRDVLVWPKAECEHLKIPMPSGTETIILMPLAQADRFIGCILAFSGLASGLGRVKRTFKGVIDVVGRAAYRAALAEELIESQYRDTLTGHFNRAAIIDALTRATASENFSLVLIEGANFKDLNERLGRSIADDLLRALGETLSEVARKQDVIYRTAAAQFGILMRDTDEGTVQRVAERAMEAIATREKWPGDLAAWNASCAVAHSTECGGATRMLETADDVMLYMRENNWEGRILTASQVPKAFFTRREKAAGVSGSLSVFNPEDIIRNCTKVEKAGVLRVTPADSSASEFWAYFEFGGIKKARCGKLRGEDAVIEFLTMFEDGTWKFREASAETLTGTTDDVSQLGRSYNVLRSTDELATEATLYKQHMQQATGLIPTANLYVMANPESETASAWEDLRTIKNSPSQIEVTLMGEIIKLANGNFRLSEIFVKLDAHPTARVRRCAALMLRHKLIRLNSLKMYARG